MIPLPSALPDFAFKSLRGGRCERLASWAPAPIVACSPTPEKERKGKERGGTTDKDSLSARKKYANKLITNLFNLCYTIRVEKGKGSAMDFEQMTDRVEKLAGERALLLRRLAQCDKEILSLTDGDDSNRYAAIRAAIRLANRLPTQAIKSVVVVLASRKYQLEATLPLLSPERAQESETKIKECAERLDIYCQVFRSRELGISR